MDLESSSMLNSDALEARGLSKGFELPAHVAEAQGDMMAWTLPAPRFHEFV